MEILKRTFRYIGSTLIAWFIIKCITEALPLMSDLGRHIAEGAANPKVIGGAAGTGWVTTAISYVDSAAPNILVYLSIAATVLTIWAFFSNRKRQKQEQMQKDEAHRAQMENESLQKQLLQEQLREVSIRAEAQDMLVERLAKKHPEAAEEIAEETLDNIVSWNAKRKAN